MKNLTTRRLAVSGMIGAAYAVMAIFGSVFGLTFGPIQFRFSEALCVTPFLFPEAVGGLFVGCLIANLFSPYGLLDIIIGSLATLIAAWLTARCRSRYLAPLPPVIVNMVLVGYMSLVKYWFTWNTKHLPSMAMCLMVSCHSGLLLVLGHRYRLTPF